MHFRTSDIFWFGVAGGMLFAALLARFEPYLLLVFLVVAFATVVGILIKRLIEKTFKIGL